MRRPSRTGTVALALSAVLLATVVASAPAARPGPGGVNGTLTVSDAAVMEGSAGTATLVFTVQLSGSAKSTATVSYATANGTATAPADDAATSGTLAFDKRTRTRTVTVQVVGDSLNEQDETLVHGSRACPARRSRTAQGSARSWTTTEWLQSGRRSRQPATSPAIQRAERSTAG